MVPQPASSPTALENTLRRFYRRYKPLFAHFQTTLQGIARTAELIHYAALLVNRLMFLCFLQQHGWLDGDPNYLGHAFEACQQRPDTFYQHFLLPLCQQLYSPPPRGTTFAEPSPFGTLPRFTLALFAPHPVEQQPATPVHIPDSAFAPLLAFFSTYRWQLDASPPQAEHVLSPAVLSYVLEQQVTQKEMGVYYTKDDVTTYIVQNTLVPYLLQAVQAATPAGSLLPLLRQLLRTHPDRYIQPSLQSSAYLPLETELDYKKRQDRYQLLRARLAASALHNIDDLITWHLDIPRLAQDAILTTTDPWLLLAFSTSLEQLTILDPTCGCGAFLLAALDVLEPLYAACLVCIQTHLHAFQPETAELHAVFLAILQRLSCAAHPRYPIIAAILHNNLYGVDIMQNAATICQQRLFLRLLQALVPPATPSLEMHKLLEMQTSPPDLDSHIRTGNALQGAVYEHELQVSGETTHAHHFHWFRHFPTVMQQGGFSVILGNPPYVEYSKLPDDEQYSPTEHWGNVYGAVIARSLALCRAGQSYLGLIVPLSICNSDRFAPLRQNISASTARLWLANFEIFPCRIFDRAFQRLSILLAHSCSAQAVYTCQLYVTHLQRWYAAERPHLLPLLAYTEAQHPIKPSIFPKLASALQERIFDKVARLAQGHRIADLLSPHPTNHLVYYQEATNNWIKATCSIPFYRKNGQVSIPPHGRLLFFDAERTASTIMAILNSGLFYLWFATYADGFHLSHALVRDFPLARALLTEEALPQLALTLEQDSKANARLTIKNTRPSRQQQRAGDVIELEAYHMVHSKPLLDEIDAALARCYDFTDEELEFILQYDLKYRMGKAYPER